MENALFVKYNPSNNNSLTDINNKNSDAWVKKRLKELISLNSIHTPHADFNAKGILSKEVINEDCNNNKEPYYNVNLVFIYFLKY